jgi:hypothetical protein
VCGLFNTEEDVAQATRKLLSFLRFFFPRSVLSPPHTRHPSRRFPEVREPELKCESVCYSSLPPTRVLPWSREQEQENKEQGAQGTNVIRDAGLKAGLVVRGSRKSCSCYAAFRQAKEHGCPSWRCYPSSLYLILSPHAVWSVCLSDGADDIFFSVVCSWLTAQEQATKIATFSFCASFI